MTPIENFSHRYEADRRQTIEKALITARNIIKQFEGCRLHAYQCSAGVWTIGWGHTRHVRKGDCWTQAKADQTLEEDIITFAQSVLSKAPGLIGYPNRYAACISLAYNIGTNAFAQSTLCRLIRESSWSKAADAFMSWCFVAGRKSPGLIRRRTLERQIFLKDSQ